MYIEALNMFDFQKDGCKSIKVKQRCEIRACIKSVVSDSTGQLSTCRADGTCMLYECLSILHRTLKDHAFDFELEKSRENPHLMR